MDVKGKIRKFTWRIENFSSIEDQIFDSEIFIVDGIKWQIRIFPKGNCWINDLRVHLVAADYNVNLRPERNKFAQVGLAVIDQNDRKRSSTRVQRKYFKVSELVLDTKAYLKQDEFHDRERGYLIGNACVVEAYVSTCRTGGLVSHQLIIESVSDGHKLKAYGSVKAKPVEFTTFLSTPPSSSQIVDIESEEPTEEDMKTFFGSIESEFLCSSNNIVYSQEAAREAVAKLDEALSPRQFYYLGRIFPLKNAFKILSTRTTLTIKQKNELLAMEERLKELADQDSKSLQYVNQLDAKESKKLTIAGNIKSGLIRYKEVESEVEQVKRKLAALHEQKDNMLNEQKEIFRSSKKMKTELVALQKECAEVEGNARAAVEEEKAVEAELKGMKDFIASIKGKI